MEYVFKSLERSYKKKNSQCKLENVRNNILVDTKCRILEIALKVYRSTALYRWSTIKHQKLRKYKENSHGTFEEHKFRIAEGN